METPREDPKIGSNSIYVREDFILDRKLPQIRVLELISHDSTTVKCKIARLNLLDKPIYDALSYVWGPSEPSKWMEIDGRAIPITPNLFAALCSLCQDSSLRRLWVDAICINQDDVDEKEQQIAMMADIYRSATTVRIYLGGNLPTRLGLLDYWNREGKEPDEHLEDTLPRLGISMQGLLDDFMDFVSRPWWTRVWTQQEYTLAAHGPVFYLGSRSVLASETWKDFERLHNAVVNVSTPFMGSHDVELKTNLSLQKRIRVVIHAAYTLNRRHEGRNGLAFHTPLAGLFEHFVLLRSTDPRDKIFGLREIAEPVVQRLFQPNYRAPVEDVFEKLAAWLLVFDLWEEMFWNYPLKLSAGNLSRNIPSWVPDFSRPLSWSSDELHSRVVETPDACDCLPLTALEPQMNLLPSVREGAHVAGPVIYDGILALGGRELDGISNVFHMGHGLWHNLLPRLWYLDQFFTRENPVVLYYASDPLSQLLRRYSQRQLHGWAFRSHHHPGADLTIAFSQDSLTHPEVFKILLDRCQCIQRELVTLSDIVKVEDYIVISDHQFERMEHDPPLAEDQRSCIEETKATIQNVFLGVASRLAKLLGYLAHGLKHPLGILGAALFNYENLESQLKRLRRPSSSSSPDTLMIKLLAAKLGPLIEVTSTESVVPGVPFAGIDEPIYEDLQSHITECESEPEVQLRVRFVLQVAETLRAVASKHICQGHLPDRDLAFAKATGPPPFSDDADREFEKYAEIVRRAGEAYRKDNSVRTLEDSEADANDGQNKLDRHEAQVAQQSQHKRKLFSRVFEELEAQFKDRTFFVTKRGFVGYGAPGVSDIRVADTVILLENARMPLVVRTKTQEHFEIVGFSIVRELIKEDWKSLEELKTLPRRVFKFR